MATVYWIRCPRCHDELVEAPGTTDKLVCVNGLCRHEMPVPEDVRLRRLGAAPLPGFSNP